MVVHTGTQPIRIIVLFDIFIYTTTARAVTAPEDHVLVLVLVPASPRTAAPVRRLVALSALVR